MTDLLRYDYINSLQQPLFIRKFGDKEIKWPLHDIEVVSGLLRFDVCGLLEVSHISDVKLFIDGDGKEHDPDTFYSDYEVAA